MKTVLVVDDEFGIAEALSSLLSDEGYRVLTAGDGHQALNLLPEAHPDVILTDFMMPVQDGAALIRALRQDPRFKDVPVVLMSAVPEASVRPHTTDYQAFLRKPFGSDQLLEILRKVL